MSEGRWRRWRRSDSLNAGRRHIAMWADRSAARPVQRLRPPHLVPFDGEPRLALVTVNFSTTGELKLMLATLAGQRDLAQLRRLVVVDNGSRDGGLDFLRALADRVPRVHLVERRRWLHHGPAMRAGVRALDRLDALAPNSANVLLFCDPDVIFLAPEALDAVSGSFVAHHAALVGEVRPGDPDGPDIQASFVAVRRDVLARRDIAPVVHDGSPTKATQASIVAAGLTVVDLPTNRAGLILHRGRAGVAAAARYRPRNAYATARQQEAHFMGVPNGAEIWRKVEQEHADLLGEDPDAERRLLDLLTERFTS